MGSARRGCPQKTKHYESRLDVAGPFTINFKEFKKNSLAGVRYLTAKGSGLFDGKGKEGQLETDEVLLTEKNLEKL